VSSKPHEGQCTPTTVATAVDPDRPFNYRV
jgi:hypothetical protein